MIAAAFAIIGGLAGCGSVQVDLTSGKRSIYAPVDQLPPEAAFVYEPDAQSSGFVLRERASWIAWGVPLNHPQWEERMKEALGNANGAANLRVQFRMSGWDAAVCVLTLGFYRSTEVTITGEKIRFTAPEPPPHLLPPGPPPDAGEPSAPPSPPEPRAARQPAPASSNP